MKLLPVLSATLLGTAATIALVQPYAVALSPEQVDTIARQVTVQIYGQNPGSGVIIAKQGQTYTVLTAAHVVPSPDDYDIITPDGQKYPIDYKLVRKLPGVDLALISFTSAKNYQVVIIGSSSQVRAGTPAHVSGFPISRLGDGKTTYRFTIGRIDAHASRPLANGYALAYINDTFAGMSGGPILDQEGKLIGIHGTTKTPFLETQGVNYDGLKQGLNLGIPVDTFLRLAPQVTTSLKSPNVLPSIAPQKLTADDLFIQGVELLIAGKPNAALDSLNQAIRVHPSYASALFFRGGIHSQRGDIQAAIADYSEAIRIDPKYVRALSSRGFEREKLDDLQGALVDHTEAIRLDPKYTTAFNNRGITRRKLNDLQGAIADFNEAIRLDPKFAPAFFNRGIARRKLNNFKGAISDLNEAIRLEPKSALAFYGRGYTRDDLGDLQGAISDYTEAIRLDPKYASAFYARALPRGKSGDVQGAIADLQQAAILARQQGDQSLYQKATEALKQLGAGLPSPSRHDQPILQSK
jgi:tetratricopeptide (TPR) repeat protein